MPYVALTTRHAEELERLHGLAVTSDVDSASGYTVVDVDSSVTLSSIAMLAFTDDIATDLTLPGGAVVTVIPTALLALLEVAEDREDEARLPAVLAEIAAERARGVEPVPWDSVKAELGIR